MIGVLEQEESACAAASATSSLTATPRDTRRASLNYWSQIEASAVATVLGPTLELAKSFTVAVTTEATNHISTFTTPRSSHSPRSKQVNLTSDEDVIRGVMMCAGLPKSEAEAIVSASLNSEKVRTPPTASVAPTTAPLPPSNYYLFAEPRPGADHAVQLRVRRFLQ